MRPSNSWNRLLTYRLSIHHLCQKCPYTEPKEQVLLQRIAYFKIAPSNVTELLSVISDDSAHERCVFPAADSQQLSCKPLTSELTSSIQEQ